MSVPGLSFILWILSCCMARPGPVTSDPGAIDDFVSRYAHLQPDAIAAAQDRTASRLAAYLTGDDVPDNVVALVE